MPRLKIDNPFFRFMGRLGDLVVLNLLWTLCCLPVVTAGASSTALWYVARKIAAKEDYTVSRDFFRSFRQNFRQALAVWIILLVLLALTAADFLIGANTPGASGSVFKGIGIALGVLWLLLEGFSFLLLARFEYRTGALLPNALQLAFKNLPAAVTYAVLTLALPALVLRAPEVASYVLPFWLLIGRSLTALAVSVLLQPAFKRLEAGKTGDIEEMENDDTEA